MLPRFPLHQLHVFAIVAERSSFGRAAAALNGGGRPGSSRVRFIGEVETSFGTFTRGRS